MHQSLRDRLKPIQEALQTSLELHEWERLGGLTNQNFRIDTNHGPLVLRLAGPGTSAYIDRAAEEINARAASAAGVNAELLYFDKADGTMLCRFLTGYHTMSEQRIRMDGATLRAGQAMARLHHHSQPFQGHFELFEQVDRYQKVLQEKAAPLPQGYDEALFQTQSVRQALQGQALALAPCHCDPLVENFLDDGQSMRIIDFEYSGMNDPMWDLGDLAVEGNFRPEQEEALLYGYFGSPPPPEQRARVIIYKAMCDLLWTLWGVVQHVDGNPADDFWAYATGRLQRCRRLMQQREFSQALELLATP